MVADPPQGVDRAVARRSTRAAPRPVHDPDVDHLGDARARERGEPHPAARDGVPDGPLGAVLRRAALSRRRRRQHQRRP